MEEKEKFPEKDLNEMEASNITDEEFKTMVIRMLKDFQVIMDDFSENLKNEIVSLKNNMKTIKTVTKEEYNI